MFFPKKIRNLLKLFTGLNCILPILLVSVILFSSTISFGATYPYQDETLSYRERALDLVARMTISEKVGQLNNFTPAITRLGLKDYIYQQEAIHGWFGWNNYQYTVFPVPMAMGATWDPDLIWQVGKSISDEARANYNYRTPIERLNVYAPTINLARDPRWGRTEETYSEDPYLLSRFAVSYVTGMQGNNAKYLKTGTTVKHFAANNYEVVRNYGSSNVDERSLREYYFPAFQAGILEGKSRSVMNAYNALNNIPCNTNGWLLQNVLRGDWGFDGFVTSDCGDITDTVTNHHYVATLEEASALSVRSGCDQDCGSNEFRDYLPNAIAQKLITEADLDIALRRVLETRFLFGELDAIGSCPYNTIPLSEIDSQEHRDLTRQVEREAIVLLKNTGNLLPLSKSINAIALIGPYANDYYLGGYTNNNPFYKVSPYQGIRNKLPNVTINYSQGTNMDGSATETMINNAVNTAQTAGIALVVLGTNDSFSCEGRDAANLNLPGRQTELAQRVYAANPNTIVVLCSGNPMSINWIAQNIPAILETWHGGQEYGNALADVLFGDYNPAGRVPQTYYKDSNLLPALDDYNIFNKRLYMYCDDPNVLYPFGYGLSYTTFTYSNLLLSKTNIKNYEEVQVSVDVRNAGSRAGDEVVQVYLKDESATVTMPKKALKGFKRVALNPGETKTVTITLKGMDGAYYNTTQQRFVVEPGNFQVQVGASSTDIRQSATLYIDWVAPRFEGFYKIVNRNSGLVLEIVNDTQDYNGQNVRQGNYYGYNNQKWTIEQVEPDYFKIVNRQSGCVLDVQDGSLLNGANVQEWNYGGVDQQKFRVNDLGGGYYSLIAKHSGKGVEVQGASTLDGANVQQYTYSGANNQQWQLVQVNDSTAVSLPPSWITEQKVFMSSSANNKYVGAKNNNLSLAANRTTAGANELFYLYDLGGSTVAIKSGLNSKFLGVDTGTTLVYADRSSAETAETFERIDLGDGKFAYKSKLNNQYLSAGTGGNEPLKANKSTIGTSETFLVTDSTLSPKDRAWTATSNYNNNAARLAFDLEPSTRWDTGTPQVPGMWYKLNLNATEEVRGLILDSANSPGDYPRGYTVEVSTNDSTWTQVAAAAPGTVVQQNGVVTITFNPVQARYLKITQTGSDPGCYWSIHELTVDSTPSVGTKYEAENGTVGNGATIANDSNASGGKCIHDLHIATAYCQIGSVNGGQGGSCTLNVYYATMDTSASLNLYVNGVAKGYLTLPSSGGWSNFTGCVQTTVTLNSGTSNTIKLENRTGGVNLDYITVIASSSPPLVALKAKANDKYVSTDPGITPANGLVANRTSVGSGELFQMIDNGDGTVSLKSNQNGKYICADIGYSADAILIANRDAIGPWEKFQKISNGDGTFSFKAQANNKYVCADIANFTPAGLMVANRTAIGQWEKFEIINQ